jgi:hypothetical protein
LSNVKGKVFRVAWFGLGVAASRGYAADVKQRSNPETVPKVDAGSLSDAERTAGYAGMVTIVLADAAVGGAGEQVSVLLTRSQLQALAEQTATLLAKAAADEPDFFMGIRETLAKHREALETSRRTFAAQREERAEREVRQERIEQRVEDKR